MRWIRVTSLFTRGLEHHIGTLSTWTLAADRDLHGTARAVKGAERDFH